MTILLLAAAMALGLRQEVTPLESPATARRKYDTLVEQVENHDMAIDWRELRLAARVAGVNGNFDWREQHQKVQAAFKAGKFEDGLRLAKTIVAHNLASLNGHFDEYIAYKNAKVDVAAAKEQAILAALLKSISTSGDGKTPATAFFVVDTSEEYVFLQLVANARPTGQALVHQDGHDYDKMTATDKNGAEVVYWFNVDTDMQLTRRALGNQPQ